MRSILYLIVFLCPLGAVLFGQHWVAPKGMATRVVRRKMDVRGLTLVIDQLENEIRRSYERAQFGEPLR